MARLELTTGREAPVSSIENIFYSLRQISHFIHAYSRDIKSRQRLTVPQTICLRYLADHGPSSANILAKAASLSPATLTGVIDRLEQQGLAVRTRGGSDRRKITVELTEQGRIAATEAPRMMDSLLASRLSHLSAEEVEYLAEALSRVVRLMEGVQLADPAGAAEPPAAESGAVKPY